MCVFLYIRQHTEDYSYFHTIGQHQFNSMHANARTAAAIYLNDFHVNRDIPAQHTSLDFHAALHQMQRCLPWVLTRFYGETVLSRLKF